MLRKTALLIGLLLVTLTGKSQSFSGGMYFGLTSNQIDGDGLGGFDHTGALLGVFAERPLSGPWKARLELQYIWRGAREPVSDTSRLYRTDLHQISIPVVLGYDYKKWDFEAGLSGDINVITRTQDLYGYYDANPPYNTFVLNSVLGVGYRASENWVFRMRQNYSLSAVQDVRIVNRPPGILGDWIKGSHTVTLSLAAYYYF